MGHYIKPNLELPVSLHDAKVTKITRKEGAPQKGELTLYFKEGYRVQAGKDWISTGEGEVRFQGIDWDFSSVRYVGEKTFTEISFLQFQKDLEESSFEIVEESYGYNRSVFSGYRYQDGFFKVEVEIYHFQETEYLWTEERLEMDPPEPLNNGSF